MISITNGDLTKENVDIIIVPTNTSGNYFGGVDNAIKKVAKGQYHNALLKKQFIKEDNESTAMKTALIYKHEEEIVIDISPEKELRELIMEKDYDNMDEFNSTPINGDITNLSTYIIEKEREHKGGFNQVLFIVDADLDLPIKDVVYTALKSADEYGAENDKKISVGIPLFRQGLMKSVQEIGDDNYVDQYTLGLIRFIREEPEYISEIRVVIYNDELMAEKMKDNIEFLLEYREE